MKFKVILVTVDVKLAKRKSEMCKYNYKRESSCNLINLDIP